MHITTEDINTAGIICQQYNLNYMWEMEMANRWVSSGRTKLSWKECRIYMLKSFSPCFYKNRTCPSVTKRKNQKGARPQVNLPWISCSSAVLWPYASKHKATRTVPSSVRGGTRGKACSKLSANQSPTIPFQRVWMKCPKILHKDSKSTFHCNSWVQAKRSSTKRTAGLFRKCFVCVTEII